MAIGTGERVRGTNDAMRRGQAAQLHPARSETDCGPVFDGHHRHVRVWPAVRRDRGRRFRVSHVRQEDVPAVRRHTAVRPDGTVGLSAVSQGSTTATVSAGQFGILLRRVRQSHPA